ncbi:tail fiber assembly protein [Xenorhabdus doucetiae]|uniref:Putative tail fiber assembly protein n=1 Tax=Xenorhabdus doucetiae TaxID=351671 RepID=A0A068QUZ6_9GAMM
MHYYINENTREIYAYENEIDSLELTPIPEAEALAIANPPPTAEQLREQATFQKQYLMSQASNSIAPLQYAVDLDMATDGERAALTAWKKYCVLLNRVDCSAAPNIDWPNAPE